eukprot:1587340-Rhodomonas_salina.1
MSVPVPPQRQPERESVSSFPPPPRSSAQGRFDGDPRLAPGRTRPAERQRSTELALGRREVALLHRVPHFLLLVHAHERVLGFGATTRINAGDNGFLALGRAVDTGTAFHQRERQALSPRPRRTHAKTTSQYQRLVIKGSPYTFETLFKSLSPPTWLSALRIRPSACSPALLDPLLEAERVRSGRGNSAVGFMMFMVPGMCE